MADERTFLDVCVFNPQPPVFTFCLLSQTREGVYEQRIRETEHASFTPVVLSATSGMGREATTFYKHLASMLASKWDQPYSCTLAWLRCRLAFSLLRAAIQCLRGARSSGGHAAPPQHAVDLIHSCQLFKTDSKPHLLTTPTQQGATPTNHTLLMKYTARNNIALSCQSLRQLTEDCKLVVRLQMQNTLGIVVIGQLGE